MRMVRIAVLAALAAGISVGLAGPASADSLSGIYRATVIGGSIAPVGVVKTWVFTPCGAGCAARDVPDKPNLHCEFRLQGGTTWSCSPHEGVSDTLDADTLVAHSVEPGGTIDWQLIRN